MKSKHTVASLACTISLLFYSSLNQADARSYAIAHYETDAPEDQARPVVGDGGWDFLSSGGDEMSDKKTPIVGDTLDNDIFADVMGHDEKEKEKEAEKEESSRPAAADTSSRKEEGPADIFADVETTEEKKPAKPAESKKADASSSQTTPKSNGFLDIFDNGEAKEEPKKEEPKKEEPLDVKPDTGPDGSGDIFKQMKQEKNHDTIFADNLGYEFYQDHKDKILKFVPDDKKPQSGFVSFWYNFDGSHDLSKFVLDLNADQPMAFSTVTDLNFEKFSAFEKESYQTVKKDSPFYVVMHGNFIIEHEGQYMFQVKSGTGDHQDKSFVRMLVDSEIAVDMWEYPDTHQAFTQTVGLNLKAGTHEMLLVHVYKAGEDNLEVMYAGKDTNNKFMYIHGFHLVDSYKGNKFDTKWFFLKSHTDFNKLDLGALNPDAVGTVESINFEKIDDFKKGKPEFREVYFAGRIEGAFEIKQAGDYDFKLYVNDGANVKIDGKQLFKEWNKKHQRRVSYNKLEGVSLTAGIHVLQVDYMKLDNPTQKAELVLEYLGPDTKGEFLFLNSEIKQDDLEKFDSRFKADAIEEAATFFGTVDDELIGTFYAFKDPELIQSPEDFEKQLLNKFELESAIIDPVKFDSIEDFKALPNVGNLGELFYVTIQGYIRVKTEGKYTFALQYKGGIHTVLINDVVLFDNSFAVTTETKMVSKYLMSGQHKVIIRYFGHKDATLLKLAMQHPDGSVRYLR